MCALTPACVSCPSHGRERSPEVPAGEDQDDPARLEAERKLEELKRRRDDAESEEFERMRQRQQEAEAELEELKRKREERRKVLEEEERQKKQEEAERKAREEVEKRDVLMFVCFFNQSFYGCRLISSNASFRVLSLFSLHLLDDLLKLD